MKKVSIAATAAIILALAVYGVAMYVVKGANVNDWIVRNEAFVSFRIDPSGLRASEMGESPAAPAPAQPHRTIHTDMFHVEFSDGITSRTLEGADFSKHQGTDTVTSGEYATKLSGTLHIQFIIEDEERGVIVSRGTVELPLKPDWSWGVDFVVSDFNPYDACFGCFGSQAFPLHEDYGGGTDKLFIVWGGNSIKNPVNY